MANVLNELYFNLNGWTKNLQFFPTFSNLYVDGVNTFTYKGGDGYERLYIPIEVETGWNYSFKFNLCSPSGFEMGEYGLNEAFAFVCPDPPIDDDPALSRKILGRSASWDTAAETTPKEYEVSFYTGNYTTLFLVFDFGYIKDGATVQFIISNIQLDDGAVAEDYEKHYIIKAQTLNDIAKKIRNIIESYDLLMPEQMVQLLSWVNDPFTDKPVSFSDTDIIFLDNYYLIQWKTLKKIANVTRILVENNQFLSLAEIIALLDQVKIVKVLNISSPSSDGTQIAIEFSEPITGDYTNPENIFTVKVKEYDMVPGGVLTEKTKKVLQITNQSSVNHLLNLSEGNLSGLQVTNNSLTLGVST